MENVKLNLIPGLNNPVCHVSQYDIGRIIRLNLFEGSSIYTLSGNEIIRLNVRKPDNTILEEQLVNTSSTYVTFDTSEQMCPLPGDNVCELSIESNGTIIRSINFLMKVEKSPLYKGIEVESSVEDLDEQVKEAISSMTFDFGLHSKFIDIKTYIYTYVQ